MTNKHQGWQPIATAPRDGTLFRSRGRDWGDPAGKYHYSVAKWGRQRPGESMRFVDLKNRQLVYLTDWKAPPPEQEGGL